MPTNGLLEDADKLVESFDKNLFKVLREMDARIIDIITSGKGVAGAQFDAATILNSRPAMVAVLEASGYNTLAGMHIEHYKHIPALVAKTFDAAKLPLPKYTTADAQTFTDLARADLEAFSVIGEKAMDDLRLGLYRRAVANQPFSDLVAAVRASTVGNAVNGSPLRNYAYTHANTAVLNFQGEVLAKAGQSIGATRWEVVGPLDGVTRDACVSALADPIRTEAEWNAAGYWGGTPGGFNCRHQLFPVVE
jgi:hypothetical protein